MIRKYLSPKQKAAPKPEVQLVQGLVPKELAVQVKLLKERLGLTNDELLTAFCMSFVEEMKDTPNS